MEPAILRIATAEDLRTLRALRCREPARPILAVIEVEDPELVVRAIESGATGVTFVLPDSELGALASRLPVIACAAAVICGLQARVTRGREFGLTCREREVLALLVDGGTALQIARRLGITFSTAQTHVKNIYRKLGTGSKAQATAIALRNHLV